MSSPLRPLIALLALSLALPISAADPTPADARRAALVKAGYTPIPLTVDRQLFLNVEGKVGPEKVRFQLDSGSDDTMLDLSVAKRLNLKLGEEVPSIGAGGERIDRQVEFPGLMLGTYNLFEDWKRFEGVAGDLSGVSNNPPSGLFGMRALQTWATVIDYPARTLYLRPTLTSAWPRLSGSWVVTSWQEDGENRKLDIESPPTFTFAERRLKLADGGQTREHSIRLMPIDSGVYQTLLFDPKSEGNPEFVPQAGGLVKLAEGRMTACLALDIKKAKKLPPRFAAPKGSGYVLLELKQSVASPAGRKSIEPLRELLIKEGYAAIPLEKASDTRVATAQVGRHSIRLIVDTGTNVSVFETKALAKWGATRTGSEAARGLGGRVKVDAIQLRGLMLGKYDTRQAWAVLFGYGLDLANLNQSLIEDKLPAVQGLLGNLDLFNGSAVIDFGTNTLYLRPIKDTLWPRLQGMWTGVRYEMDGRKGPYKPGEAAIEFKDGRIRFTTKNAAAEWGFHLREEGDKYRIGLFDPKADMLADGFKYASGGLLKLSGDKITLLMEQGSVRKEPTEFAAPAGSGLLLVEYERAIDAAKLIGKWNWVARKGADPSVLEFRKDGTMQITIMSKEADLVLVGKYKIEGKKVVLIGEGRNYVYFINKFTDTEFSWTADEDKVTESYTRVKEK